MTKLTPLIACTMLHVLAWGDTQNATQVPDPNVTVNLGVLIPWTGSWPAGRRSASAVIIAVEDLNADLIILPGRTVRFSWMDTNCNAHKGLEAAVSLFDHFTEISPHTHYEDDGDHSQKLHAYIGGACDEVCEPVGLWAGVMNIPMVSYGCSASKLSNKVQFPTFVRTVGPYAKIARMFWHICAYFKWNHVGILASTESVWQVIGNAVKSTLESKSATIGDFHSVAPGSSTTSKDSTNRGIMQTMGRDSRIRFFFIHQV
ncbi:guanylate cyclase 32E-like [Lingula anatina]|uniref:Guanylate cyclase 32E-like n=1 Tax=Lingula anatina TaxID=7574 RepID=A0A2R2MNA8_LINAN|nr:guanylate cyclase 32E-like [Lingula anatina]|eukprot:XP_023931696.1 guanylate cyclase 32E-like [Lingula anatina]